MPRRSHALALALILGTGALTACSSDKKSSTPAASTPGASVTTVVGATTVDTAGPESVVPTEPGATSPAPTGAVLTIKDFAFGAVSVKAGELFTITNTGSAAHTVTADDGSFRVEMPPGASSDLVIPTAGTYKIHCEIHSSMTGTIEVS